jgi:predicted nucleic acid-binding protein
MDTLEVMIVENHEIKETQEEDPSIVVTGRSFVSYLEQRVVVPKMLATKFDQYILVAGFTWNQIVTLINDHVANGSKPQDSLINVVAQTTVTGTGESIDRVVEFGILWDRVADLLKIDDLGIKTIRRNTFGISGSPTQTIMMIYKGINRSSSVRFAWKSGDLLTAEYLFSNKSDKNAAAVIGQYVFTIVTTAGVNNYNRRYLFVDAKDIDGNIGATPTSQALTQIEAQMAVRGHLALAVHNNVTITQADISEVTKFVYRQDYNVGDLISLDGNFGQTAIMRVLSMQRLRTKMERVDILH